MEYNINNSKNNNNHNINTNNKNNNLNTNNNNYNFNKINSINNTLNEIKESELSNNNECENNYYQIPIPSKLKRKTVIEKMIERDKTQKKKHNYEDFNIAVEEAFNDFDKDHSDFISKDELGNFMKSLGYILTEI
jgi:hypothetical protein